jgi:hypothetical protein
MSNNLYYDYAANSSFSITGKVHKDKAKQTGIIQADVSISFSKDKSNNNYSFTVYTLYNLADLTKEIPKMRLVQAYKFANMPSDISASLPRSAFDKYAVLDLSENEIVKDYIIRAIGQKAPSFNDFFSSLSWTRLTPKSYKINFADSDVERFLLIPLANSLFTIDDTWSARLKSASEVFNFTNTTAVYEIDNNNFVTKKHTFDMQIDMYKLQNKIFGVPNGRNVLLPLTVNADISYRSINAVQPFSFPTLSASNQYSIEALPIARMLPSFRDVPAAVPSNISVSINDAPLEFHPTLPPIIYNDRILLPVKYMVETQGGSLTASTNNDILTGIIALGADTTSITKDSNLVSIMGAIIDLPTNIGIAYDTFYAPVQLFSEVFNMDVQSYATPSEDGTNNFTINFTSKV